MQGYWRLPEETDKVLRVDSTTGDRVLHTGDLFTRDEDGYLYFVARTDDIIKTGLDRKDRIFCLSIANVTGVSGANLWPAPVSGEVRGQGGRVRTQTMSRNSLSFKFRKNENF